MKMYQEVFGFSYRPWLSPAAALLILVLASCTTTGGLGNPESPYPAPRPPEVGDILHIPTGIFVTEAQMIDAAVDTRVVYIGETHDNPASHRLEVTVLKAMADQYPGLVALGMEMFNSKQQPVLDRWVAGEIDEKEFLKKSDWFHQWNMDFEYYKPLLLLSRDLKIPIVGLNTDKELVMALSVNDLDELTEEESQRQPEMDMDDPYHADMVAAVYRGHEMGKGGSAGFERVQILWDEAMAETVADYLSSSQGNGHHMVVVAGGHHIRYGFGIPRRVFRRLPTSYTLIGTETIIIPEEKQDQIMKIRMPGFPMPPYDFIVFTEYESLDRERVRLGVHLREVDGKVIIEDVIERSIAHKAGLLVQDILLRFDQTRVTEAFDIIYEVMQKKPGDQATLLIERKGEEMEVGVVFNEPGHPVD